MAGSQPIQSVVRASEILRLVGQASQGLSLAELADRLGLKPPTVHHLARTLVETGLLERTSSPVRYRIGQGLLAIASQQVGRGLAAAAAGVMQSLARQFPQANVILAQYVNGDITATLRMSADQPGVVQRPSHQSMSGYSSASSLLFQAYWPQAMLRTYRQRYPFEEYGGIWPDIATLDEFLARARQEGYVVRPSRDDTHLATAAPILTADGSILAGIGLSQQGQAGKAVARSVMKQMTDAVRASARAITESLESSRP